jgi:hypothetical protein
LLLYFFESALKNGSKETEPSCNAVYAEAMKTTKGTVKSSINRLINRGYLVRLFSVTRNHNSNAFLIPDAAWDKLIINKSSIATRQQLDSSSIAQPIAGPIAGTSSKIDSNINNNLTNYQESSEWFKQLDFKPISPITAMQVNQSIRHLVVQSLNQEQAQDFINRFQSWATTQRKINNPIAFFCDKLKEFASNKDSAVLSHKTEDERKFEAEWAQKMEQVETEKKLSEAFQIEEAFNKFLTENPDLLLKEIEKIKAENAHAAFKISDQILKTMAQTNLKKQFKLTQTAQG